MTAPPVIAAVLTAALTVAAIPWAMAWRDCKFRARALRLPRPVRLTVTCDASDALRKLDAVQRAADELATRRPRNGVVRPDRPRTHPETRVDLPVLDGRVVPRWYEEWERWAKAGWKP